MHNNKQIRSLHFDLDINKLKEHYPNKNYTEAYNDIKKFLIKNGFEHKKDSDYISKEKLYSHDIQDMIEHLTIKYNWLKTCCKKFESFIYRPENRLDLLKTINETITSPISMEKEIKQQTSKISNYQPKKAKSFSLRKNKAKNNNKDIER